MRLTLVENLEAVEELHRLRGHELRQRINRVLQIEQAALLRFLLPLRRVAVAVEDDPLVFLDHLRQQLGDSLAEILTLGQGALEFVGHRVERVGHGHIEHHVRHGDALVGSDGAELELVAGKGERARPVAVAGIAGQLRQDAHAEVHRATLLGRLRVPLLELFEDVRELVAEEHGQDGRGRFVGPEAMIVARAGNAGTQEPLPPVHRAEHRRAEHEELHVVVRRVARSEQVVAELIGQRPVVVLAGSVHAGKRLLVQQTRQAVLGRHLLQGLHRHHLMVDGDVGVLEHRRDLVLARRHLVVPRLHRHTDLEQLELRLRHEREHALRDGPEVLVFEFLPLGRLGAEERPSGVNQIGTGKEEVAVDEEVFLLGTAGREHALGGGPEQLQHADGLLRDGFHRAKQRGLLVERLAGPAHERGRDDQRDAVAVDVQPGRARRVPRGVAARFEGRAHAAGGETGCVGLALDQLLAAELGDGAAISGRREKRVVLLGRDAGHRLEPVRVVRRAVLDGPVLERGGHGVGGRQVERLPARDGGAERAIRRLRQPLLLRLVVEDETAEEFSGLRRGRRGVPLGHRPVEDALDGFR